MSSSNHQEHAKPNLCECCGRLHHHLVYDHDHVTRAFRGWICVACNVGLGNLGDDEAGLLRGLAYLRGRGRSTTLRVTRRKYGPLTFGYLNSLRSGSKPYVITDIRVPGLSIFIGQTRTDGSSGARSWWFRFYWKGKRQTLTLGQYPDIAIGIAEDLAREARSLVQRGIDPRIVMKKAKS